VRPTYLKQWFQCPFYEFTPEWGKINNHPACHLQGMCAHTGTCPAYGYVSVHSISLPKKMHGVWREVNHD